MQRPMNRRRFLKRSATAVGGAATVLTLRPGRSFARTSASAITPFEAIQPRSPDMTWYALDPEWGAGQGTCPADPNAAHLAGHDCHACKQCHSHADNKIFASAAAAADASHRAHPGCHCAVVEGGTLPDNTWVALFGDPNDPDRQVVDRRWDWVKTVLNSEDEGPVCVSGADEFGHQAFENTWRRTDQPVISGAIARTWMWGPQPYTCALYEDYDEALQKKRLVQYFDKSRMEITHPDGDSNSIWYVTNGLLVVELISGKRQMGDNRFEDYGSANVNVAGDADDPTGPWYSSFKGLLNSTAGSQESAITRVVHRDGTVTNDPKYQALGIGTSIFVNETQHWIASPFWTFMNSSGPVIEGGALVNAPLFVNAYYATGFPITDAFWATVRVAGTPRDVLIQCFERRVLTYTPGNPSGFETEAGNVGQHYWDWRYGS